MSKKRLRIFAGPNGSGKSTIFSAVDKKVGCKYFVNADEIYKSLSETGCLSFDYYTILPQEDSLKEAFRVLRQIAQWRRYYQPAYGRKQCTACSS